MVTHCKNQVAKLVAADPTDKRSDSCVVIGAIQSLAPISARRSPVRSYRGLRILRLAGCAKARAIAGSDLLLHRSLVRLVQELARSTAQHCANALQFLRTTCGPPALDRPLTCTNAAIQTLKRNSTAYGSISLWRPLASLRVAQDAGLTRVE